MFGDKNFGRKKEQRAPEPESPFNLDYIHEYDHPSSRIIAATISIGGITLDPATYGIERIEVPEGTVLAEYRVYELGLKFDQEQRKQLQEAVELMRFIRQIEEPIATSIVLHPQDQNIYFADDEVCITGELSAEQLQLLADGKAHVASIMNGLFKPLILEQDQYRANLAQEQADRQAAIEQATIERGERVARVLSDRAVMLESLADKLSSEP